MKQVLNLQAKSFNLKFIIFQKHFEKQLIHIQLTFIYSNS